MIRLRVDLPAPLGAEQTVHPGQDREAYVLQRLDAVGVGPWIRRESAVPCSVSSE